MTESTMRKKLKTEFKKLGIKLIPIETGGTALGIPDCYYYGRYNDQFISGWIELKTEWKFQPGQKKFNSDYNLAGGKAWVLLSDWKYYHLFENSNFEPKFPDYNEKSIEKIAEIICKENVNI